MHLTYLDDGGKGAVKVFGGIVVTDQWFSILESQVSMIAAQLVPLDRRAKFRFHASDLFHGKNDFRGIDEDKRHAALFDLIQVLQVARATYVYSAIDMSELQKGPVRSARWTDIAFFMCACAIDMTLDQDVTLELRAWAQKVKEGNAPSSPPHIGRTLNLMVIDEPEQEVDRGRIRSTFRELRSMPSQAMTPTNAENTSFTWSNRLTTAVDDVFFGSSADSVGLQVADACNWVMWRRLLNNTEDRFYEQLMRGRVICAKPEPEWTKNRHLFKCHDDVA